MVQPSTSSQDKILHGRKQEQGQDTSSTSGIARTNKTAGSYPTSQNGQQLVKPKVELQGLKDYQLADCLGRGAFGSVFRALNWGTGETVAVKQVKLSDLPKSDLRVILLEIDLLKSLNHPHIVKYHGFEQSPEMLYIILEYCENGSLHDMSKKYGKIPEDLVGFYVGQVLQGLIYLHEQGVIHRDIKGANILATKEGRVKLADFGVATKATGLTEASVVGTPYWMAPEVIELSGATTASDIWSLGCTIVELLDGKPPYHKLQPMPALFRIVNDDHPPLPESISPLVQDFLMQCFQKDPNLRVSARKLLKHPWVVSARKTKGFVEHDQNVKSVQQWNRALESPDNVALRWDARETCTSPTPPARGGSRSKINTPMPAALRQLADVSRRDISADVYRSPVSENNDNWDDDFASSISSSALQLPHLKPVDNFAGMLSAEKLKAYANVSQAPAEPYWGHDSDESSTVRRSAEPRHLDPMDTVRPPSPKKPTTAPKKLQASAKPRGQRVISQPETQILRAPVKQSQPSTRPKGPKRSSSVFREDSVEDYSDLIAKDDVALDQKLNQVLKSKQSDSYSPKFTHVSDLRKAPRSTTASKSSMTSSMEQLPPKPKEISLHNNSSSLEIQKFAEKTEDEDFSELFDNDETVLPMHDSESGSERGIMSVLNTKFSAHSWLDDDEDDEDDPFAQLEEDLDEEDVETRIARDKYARMCDLVESLVSSLKTTQPDEILSDTSEQLMHVLFESPEMKSVVISAHGLLPILEVLENCERGDISLKLLKIINMIILDSVEIQETLCFVGGIPIITKFAHKKYSSEIRLEAAAFVRQMYQTSTLTLQMFISCGGLNVLVEFVEEDYETDRDLVIIGVNGVWSVFELQGPTPKNDFCRIFSRSQALYPLSMVLNHVLDEGGELAELVEGRIANIFHIFSQAENHVKEIVADRSTLKRVLKDLRRMSPTHQVTMLKFIKNLSMLATTLDALQNSNAIELLTDLLGASLKLLHFRELSNQILNIMFNLCRLNKVRQQDAAESGIIPLLLRIVKTDWPLKEFALPILCDMAHASRLTRTILWQNKGLHFYVSLLADPYWSVTALDAIFIWLQEETAKVEGILLDGSFSDAIVKCFIESKADTFENLLEPLQKLLRLSQPLAATLARPELFSRIVQKFNNRKAVVRKNLLHIVRSIVDSSDEHGNLIRRYGLYEAIERLAESDPAILVRNLAHDFVRSSEASARNSMDGARYRHPRRTSSSTMSPPALHSSSSQPATPSHMRTPAQPPSYFDMGLDYSAVRPRTANINGSTPYRPVSRDGSKMAVDGSSGSSGGHSTAAAKSRLPRTNGIRQSAVGVSKKREDASQSSPAPSSAAAQRSAAVMSPRRKRQTSGGMG